MSEYKIREAQETHFEGIVALFKKHVFGPQNIIEFNYKYLSNPIGKGRLFVITKERDTIKGVAGYLPMPSMGLCNGILYQAVDGILDREVRGMNMYSHLLKYALELLDTAVIGFPNEYIEPIHYTKGFKKIGQLHDWYFPINLNENKKIRSIYVKKMLMQLSKTYYSFFLINQGNDIRIEKVSAFNEGGTQYSEYINWRFNLKTDENYQKYAFIKNKIIIGYAVYCRTAKNSADLFYFNTLMHFKKCLKELVMHCFTDGITHLCYKGANLNLSRYGFIKWTRKKRSIIGYRLRKIDVKIDLSICDW